MLMGFSFSSLIFANEEEYLFKGVSLFGEQNKQLDISKFQDSSYIEDGEYIWQAIVNEENKGEYLFELKFNQEKDDSDLCLYPNTIKKLGIYLETKAKLNDTECVFIQTISPFLEYDIQLEEQQVKFTIPDALILKYQNSKELSDLSTTALFTNYTYNYNRSQQKETRLVNEQHFLGLQSGLNMLGWALHYQSVYTIQNDVANYSSNQVTLYRDINNLISNSRLSLGHVSLDGINSVPLMGLVIETEPLMRPEGERYYAPLIEQIANSHALVKVLQNGRVVYEKSVTPGPFTIDNLRGLNQQGDLTLEIYEADNSVRRYIIPYAMQLDLLRQKQFNYSIAVGDYLAQNRTTGKQVFQGNFEYGLLNNMSISSGFSIADAYKSINLGNIYNNKFGGFATNIDYAKSEILNENGYKLQLNYQTQNLINGLALSLSTAYYSPFFPTLNSHLSTENLSFEEKISQNMKQDVQVNLSQVFPNKMGSLSFSTLVRTYWNKDDQYKQAKLSYSNSWGKLQYSLQYNYSQSDKSETEQTVFLNLSLPLGKGQIAANIQQQENTQKTLDANMQYSQSFGGTNKWSYALGTNYKQDDIKLTQNYSGSLNYNGDKNKISSAISHSEQSQQLSVSMIGGLVAHRYGITLSNILSDSFAIGHIDIENGQANNKNLGQGFDRWGNIIYSNVSPYEMNQRSFQPKDLPLNINMHVNDYEFKPSRYSSSMLVYKGKRRENVVLIIENSLKNNIPLGATVETENGDVFGIAGQSNQIFLENIKLVKNGTVIRWGKEENPQHCQLENIDFSHFSKTSDQLQVLEVTCVS